MCVCACVCVAAVWLKGVQRQICLDYKDTVDKWFYKKAKGSGSATFTLVEWGSTPYSVLAKSQNIRKHNSCQSTNFTTNLNVPDISPSNSLIWPSTKKLLNLPLFYRNTCFLQEMHLYFSTQFSPIRTFNSFIKAPFHKMVIMTLWVSQVGLTGQFTIPKHWKWDFQISYKVDLYCLIMGQ